MRRYLSLLLLLLLAACQSQVVPLAGPTPISFPTMTPGRQISGALATPIPEDPSLSNPATAVALGARPTATPDYSQCPPVDAPPTLDDVIAGGLSLVNGIAAYLNEGGSADALRNELIAAELLGETGSVQTTYDLTGEGTAEIIVTFATPEGEGVFLALTCENGRYLTRYQSVTGDNPPEILRVEDMNNDGVTDVLFAVEGCSDVDGLCQYRTTIMTWDRTEGRFINLLNTPPDGDLPPTVGDIDNDLVQEVITIQEGRGTSDTGPIRTGSQIYDWNGVSYVLSVSQPDPVRYVIEVVHEADRAFREERNDDARRLYAFALDNPDLAYWFGGTEQDVLSSYIRYRLLILFTFAENGDPFTMYEEIRTTFPDFNQAPVYALLAEAFSQRYQVSNNLNVACSDVLDLIEERPIALDLLNRYGTRSPTYTAESLCPF
jgi:hypothetical protein